ncbi:MAG: aminotransferase class V-fold PLP-dependent enzyme, partial [Gemmatimonadaceae bacterium]
MNTREFLRTMGGVTAGLVFGPELLAQYQSVPAAALAEDEPFWAAVRTKFRLNPDYINFENGYYCFQPEEVLERFI